MPERMKRTKIRDDDENEDGDDGEVKGDAEVERKVMT